ncbi:hypothetical protein ACFQT0_12760 [Hymenobacter humi]|uniref:Calcineurin-like phosphoesterase domain-containing protein n=1 Tax=Hymenobacter humi TaxID=1411620 RepID=A0ABW2U3W3_9BACT
MGTLVWQPAAAQRFAAIGDYGYASPAERDVAQLVKSWKPEFIITLGDNNYDAGEARTIDANIGQYYHEFIGSYRGSYGPGAAENRFFRPSAITTWPRTARGPTSIISTCLATSGTTTLRAARCTSLC